MKTKKSSLYPILADGGVIKTRNTHNLALKCCDCGLVHRVRIGRRGKDIFLRFWRDARRTAAARRRENPKGKG